ncbi:YbjN domain-containing protein [Rhodobacteraceae bacterium CCMM004]|nr:YbjN domain-containing protein [Rhodobacteraceae bacterium CCMM004]
MQSEGFIARLEQDDNGWPVITGKISDTPYWVYFLDCADDGSRCKGVQFHSGYALDREVSLQEMNDFNYGHRYIRAYLNKKGNPRMQMDLLMRDEGMGRETFSQYLDLWRQLIERWEKAMDF